MLHPGSERPLSLDPEPPEGRAAPLERPPSAAPLLGRQLGGYRLVRVLGQGGMGIVYEGVHQVLGRRAAIKTLLHRYSQDRAMVQRFFTEARAVNLVRHPGLVSIDELGCLPDGAAYIVMEYLQGETLRERLAGGPRPMLEVLRIGRQLASALQAAHRRGVVHRDLKPDNVMIVADPEVPGGERAKVLDFGLALIAEERGDGPDWTRTGMVMGTPRYMAPEQCRGVRPVTDRADVYSLGLNLYQMLVGHPPFEAEAMGDLLVMQIRQAPPSLWVLAPEAPTALVTLVHQMLDKAPARRPSMAQVAEALERVEAELPARGSKEGAGAPRARPPSFGPPRPPVSLSLRAPVSSAAPPSPSLPWQTEAAARAPSVTSGAAPLAPARRGHLLVTVALAGLVASGAWVGSAAGAAGWARQLLQRPAPAPARDAEATIWLLDAERALQAHAWGEALRRADRVLALEHLAPAVREEARSSRERASREQRAEAIYERLQSAAAGQRHEEVIVSFRELPPESVYVGPSRAPYEAALRPFLAARLSGARAARDARRCAEFQGQLAAVLRLEPHHPAALRLRGARCAERPHDSDD